MKQIVCWGRVIMAITMIFCDVEVSAYKVYPSSGHKCKDQLLNIDSYTYVRKHADGIWMMPWNIRTGYISDEELKIILDGFENKSMVAEINDSHVKWDSEYPEAKQLTKVLKAGAEINTIMAYLRVFCGI